VETGKPGGSFTGSSDYCVSVVILFYWSKIVSETIRFKLLRCEAPICNRNPVFLFPFPINDI